MKIYEDVLSEELLTETTEELTFLANMPNWSVSSFNWNAEIKKCVVGTVTMSHLSEGLRAKLDEGLGEYFSDYKVRPSSPGLDLKGPRAGEVTYQFYVWHRLSGISIHTDHTKEFGASLYLNKKWEPEWGGLFVWQDRDDDGPKSRTTFNPGKLQALVPKQNMLVLNDNYEPHMVTTISPVAPEERISIQIWGPIKK